MVCWLSLFSTFLFFILVRTEEKQKFCGMCEDFMNDLENVFDRNYTQVNEERLLNKANPLCGKYFNGFEEVMCRILCQINSEDLLMALNRGISHHIICQKGGVCHDGFRSIK